MTDQPMKLLAVRIPEAERRRIKSLAASQGMTLQEAVHQAMEAWAAQLQVEGALSFATRVAPVARAAVGKPKRRGGAAKRTSAGLHSD